MSGMFGLTVRGGLYERASGRVKPMARSTVISYRSCCRTMKPVSIAVVALARIVSKVLNEEEPLTMPPATFQSTEPN